MIFQYVFQRLSRCILALLIATGAVHATSLDSVPLYRLENGESIPFKLKDDTDYVAFYYSASWCPPCRKTTPPLVEEYQRMLSMEGMPAEIVLVGDQSQQALSAQLIQIINSLK